MMKPPACLRLFKSELDIINTEISKLNRLKLYSQLIGLPMAMLGLLALFFPKLLSSNITIDSISKYSSVVLGGVFFATLNFFNKGDLLGLKKRKNDLEVFLEEFENYDSKIEAEKQKMHEDCDKIIQKRKGL